MRIEIEYKLRETSELKKIQLNPEEYFDLIDGNQAFEVDSVSRNWYTIEYILEKDKSVSKDSIESSLLSITESTGQFRVEKVTYFINGNELMYLTDDKGWELIVQSIRVAENCFVSTRMQRENKLSEWQHIGYSTFLNPGLKNERYYNSLRGEFIKSVIIDGTD